MDEEIKRYSITNRIANQPAPALRFKLMFVNPLPVRPTELFVHKPIEWFPGADAGSTPAGETMHADLIVDARSSLHSDRCWSKGFEMTAGRCNGLQVGRVSEEREHIGGRKGQRKFGFKTPH